MGVSVYVMPFTRYLTGRFKTTWETRSELAGERARLSPSQAAAWLDRFKAALREKFVEPAWEDAGEALHALTLSYASFGRIAGLAGRHAGRARFPHMADPLRPFWIPARFPRPLELRDPAGGDEPVTVLSSPEAREELTRLRALHDEDPRSREMENLPPGSALTGSLADYGAERTVLASMLHAATLSVDARVPVIVEG